MVCSILALYSCQNKEKQVKENIVKTIAEDTLSKTVTDAVAVDGIPAKDDKVVEMIRKQLLVLLKKDLTVMTKEERFFYYDAFDLNKDKKNEYFIGFPSMCGTGGCSGYILNNDGSVITYFTVTDFPILTAPTSSEKFQDLIFRSRGVVGTVHLVKMKNGKYPSNPTVQEVWKGKTPEGAHKILDIDSGKLEKYSF